MYVAQQASYSHHPPGTAPLIAVLTVHSSLVLLPTTSIGRRSESLRN